MSHHILPRLVVFDLDYTLWPFWIDTHVTPPFRKDKGNIYDLSGRKVQTYPESTEVLKTVNNLNCGIAVASRTSEIEGANQLISLLDWDQFFKYKEIYAGSKVKHFGQFNKVSGIKYEEMLFFDDESRNIRDLTKLGVTCVLVDSGMTLKLLHDGLDRYAETHNLTIWKLQVDKCRPPFHKKCNDVIVDATGKVAELYPDVLGILNTFKSCSIPMSIASRITDIGSAYQLIHLFSLGNYFEHMEIYPTRKTLHFTRLHEKTKINFKDMIFFDDDMRNIRDVSKMGVKCIFVENGLNKIVVKSFLTNMSIV